MIGTFGYMAPEQLHGEATPATDLYALGATIVALAGGVEPEDVPRRGLRMDLARHLPAFDPTLREVLERMVEPDPQLRVQSAREVLALLTRAAPTSKPARAAEVVSLPATSAAAGGGPLQGLAWTPRTPLGLALRMLLVTFSIGGSLALTVIRAVILPIVFMLVHMVAGARHRPAIAGARDELAHALEEGREGFSIMRRRALGMDERKRLT